ncbi:MAG: transglutaminase domain-containing protein, partial [Pontiellaceae bacterium]|nr:transglutaminase domain-containing protein [Pontiellaceae bacterium]
GESSIREVDEILKRIRERSDLPLELPRDPSKRVTGVCRDYAVLMCSFLRHKGYSARMRVGYAMYLPGVHYICEYWCVDDHRWIRVDAQLDDLQKKYYQIDFDPTDIPSNQFLYAGQKIEVFDEKKESIYNLESTLLRDLAALNKVEVELYDESPYIRDPINKKNRPNNLNHPDFALFREIAELTTSPKDRLSDIQYIYIRFTPNSNFRRNRKSDS